MPMATIHRVGQADSNLYHIHFLDPARPDQGLPGGGVDPGYGRPSRPNRPDQSLPGHGGIPDNELPDHQPPQLAPGYTLVMVRGPHGKWEYAAIAPGSPPPRPLPPQGGGRPDQGLPGQGGHPDQGLPGGQPHPGGGPMPGNPARPDNTLPPAPQPR